MNARYPTTQLFRSLFKELRTETLHYTFDEFGAIFEFTGPWAKYFEDGVMKTKNKNGEIVLVQKNVTVPFEFIRNFFIVEYNAYLFKKKLPEMKKILNSEIASGLIKPGTTIDKLFNKKDASGQVHKVPPMSIFNPERYARDYTELYAEEHEKKQMCYIDKKYFVQPKQHCEIFEEANFEEELRYIPMIMNSEDEKNLTIEQNIRLSKWIEKRTRELLNKYKEETREQYWLYALYLMYTEVEVDIECWEDIKKHYFNEEDDAFTWRHIFSVLQNNEHLRGLKKYDDDNVVYFSNMEDIISEENLPVFHIKYNFDTMEKIKDGQTDFYDIKRENAVHLKFKLVDIFMIFMNIQLSKGYDEKVAFIKTCSELYSYGINIRFNKLCDIKCGKSNEFKADEIAIDFYFMAMKYFEKKAEEVNTRYWSKSMKLFKKNFMGLNAHFINVISMDFTDIARLSENKKSELNKELEETLRRYLDRNLF